jgi:hypothetical protein
MDIIGYNGSYTVATSSGTTLTYSSTETSAGTGGTVTYCILTVGGTLAGAFAAGSYLSGTGVTPGTVITALGTGTGGSGTYGVSPSQTVASTAIAGRTNTSLTVTGGIGADFIDAQNITADSMTVTNLTAINLDATNFNIAGFDVLLSQNGYQKLPGGLLVQWGYSTGTAPTYLRTVTFPIPFSGSPYSCVCSTERNTGSMGPGAGGSSYVYSLTATDVALYFDKTESTNQANGWWIAVGPA